MDRFHVGYTIMGDSISIDVSDCPVDVRYLIYVGSKVYAGYDDLETTLAAVTWLIPGSHQLAEIPF